MIKLKKAIIALFQEEADTWATREDLVDLDERNPLGLLLAGFNEIADEDNQIDLANDVNWH